MKQYDRFKDAVVYQVYTRSFYDSNGDGVGDFRGVIEKLDYIAGLGVDMIWLSPFCASPNKDNGYDISDYRAVMKEFGTMRDLDELIAECGKRNIEIMMDLVLNHTSAEHPWFIDSRSSVDSPKRDFYIWAKGKDGEAPNNWESYFTKDAWTYDERTGEYYLHQFYEEQPDLNWRNEELRREMVDMIRWWQAKGINAFRLDAIHHIGKPEGLPDAPDPEKPWYKRKYCNTKETHELLAMMNRELFAPAGSVTVGETGSADFEIARKYVNRGRHELNMIFHFGHLYTRTMNAASLRKHFGEWYQALSSEGWDAVFFSNHDEARHISVYGNDSDLREECAKAFAVILLTMWGTPFIYQGEELGMTNVRFDSLDEYPDESAKGLIATGGRMGMTPEESLEYFYARTRDNARTPMQWTDGKNAGFTSGTPWIKVNRNSSFINAAGQINDPSSVYSFYKQLVALRKKYAALRRGSFCLYPVEDKDVLAYQRELDGERFLVLVNFSGRDVVCRGKVSDGETWEKTAANYSDAADAFTGSIKLRPWEACVYGMPV